MCYRNVGTQHTAYLMNFFKKNNFLHKSHRMSTKESWFCLQVLLHVEMYRAVWLSVLNI